MLFNDSQKKEVARAIAEVEKNTTVEFVVVTTPSSTPLLQTAFAWTFFILAAIEITREHLFPWDSSLLILFAEILFSLVVGFALSKWPDAARVFLSIKDAKRLVEQRALNYFYQSDIKKTLQSTGVLIFISELEHQVVILADQAIAEKFPSDQWKKEVDIIVAGIKKNQPAKGVIEAIRELGARLLEDFPADENTRNELPNHVVLLPRF